MLTLQFTNGQKINTRCKTFATAIKFALRYSPVKGSIAGTKILDDNKIIGLITNGLGVEDLRKINRVISWSTKKVNNGYQFIVYSFDDGKPRINHQTGILPTRARAKLLAQKWVKFYNAIYSQNQAA